MRSTLRLARSSTPCSPAWALALFALVPLAACGDDTATPTGAASGVGGSGGSSSVTTGNGGPMGSGGAGGTGQGSGGATATTNGSGGASTTTGSTGSTSTGGIDDLEELLARLRADRDGTLVEESLQDGWPVRVAEGRVVVSADGELDEVAGDFDAWVGTPLTADQGFSWGLLPDEAGAFYKLKGGAEFVADPWARSYAYDDFGEITFVAPPSAAHLERWPYVDDGVLSPRTVRAWVPGEAATRVLYAHDGQNLFDPDAISGGWRLQEVAPAGMLIIGLDNTGGDRMDEYTHVPDDIGGGSLIGGLGDEYADLLKDVVRPLVDARYGEPGIVGLMGSSLGGLISLHVALRDSGDYDFAASLSGTLGWGSIGAANETMIERYAAAGHQPFTVYLDSGGGGDTCEDADGDGTNDDDPTARDNYCETLQMRDTLAAEGWAFDVDLFHWWEPGAPHNEAAWADRVDYPLSLFADL